MYVCMYARIPMNIDVISWGTMVTQPDYQQRLIEFDGILQRKLEVPGRNGMLPALNHGNYYYHMIPLKK